VQKHHFFLEFLANFHKSAMLPQVWVGYNKILKSIDNASLTIVTFLAFSMIQLHSWNEASIVNYQKSHYLSNLTTFCNRYGLSHFNNVYCKIFHQSTIFNLGYIKDIDSKYHLSFVFHCCEVNIFRMTGKNWDKTIKMSKSVLNFAREKHKPLECHKNLRC